VTGLDIDMKNEFFDKAIGTALSDESFEKYFMATVGNNLILESDAIINGTVKVANFTVPDVPTQNQRNINNLR
jgi:hypothetical protein